MFACVKKENNAVKSQKEIFWKSQKLLTKRAQQRQPIQNISIAIHSISMAGYVTTVLAFAAVNSQPRARAVSVSFENWPLAISPYFSPFWLKQTFVFLDVLHKDL